MPTIPAPLAAACRRQPERRAWLRDLPAALELLQERWSLALGSPFPGASCAWVAPATDRGGSPVVLKLPMPHMEAEHEADALRVWNGDGAVRLLDASADPAALLLERCEPGEALRERPDAEQDRVVASLLKRLWRRPGTHRPFRPLAAMLRHWTEATRAAASRWSDAGLVEEGLALFAELSRPSSADVLLATDLHAGNVLRARREPWLAIDPKPFVGDRAYDATQHLFNGRRRLRAAPAETIAGFSGQLEVEAERVRLWLFARAAAEPREDWRDDASALARRLARGRAT